MPVARHKANSQRPALPQRTVAGAEINVRAAAKSLRLELLQRGHVAIDEVLNVNVVPYAYV